MKILFIANTIFGENPGLSGGEVRFIEIAKHWASKGHEIHLMSSGSGAKLCSKLGLPVILHTLSDSKGVNTFAFICRAIKSLFFLPRSLDTFDEGIIYSTNEMIPDVFPALRLKLRNRNKIKWATVVHWMPPFPPWKRKEASVLNATLFFINERVSVWLANRFADVLLPVSTMTERQLFSARANRAKIRAVECGVAYDELRRIAATADYKTHDAVFMKRLQAVKGIFDLIEIWELVVKARPGARLVIIGEGIDGKKARDMVKTKGLERNIEFAGLICDLTAKMTCIANSRLFVLPTYEENWAIVIGEAMAAGTPVISYDLKELVDVWKDNFIRVPLGDKAHFANRIVQLLDSPDKLREISQKGIEYVKQYDWRVIAEKELAIISGKA